MGRYYNFVDIDLLFVSQFLLLNIFVCYGAAPTGLVHLLQTQEVRDGETKLEAKNRIYKRLWCLLWVLLSMR